MIVLVHLLQERRNGRMIGMLSKDFWSEEYRSRNSEYLTSVAHFRYQC